MSYKVPSIIMLNYESFDRITWSTCKGVLIDFDLAIKWTDGLQQPDVQSVGVTLSDLIYSDLNSGYNAIHFEALAPKVVIGTTILRTLPVR